MSVLAMALLVPHGKTQAVEEYLVDAREYEDVEKTLSRSEIESAGRN